jgi:hypothetical protein
LTQPAVENEEQKNVPNDFTSGLIAFTTAQLINSTFIGSLGIHILI